MEFNHRSPAHYWPEDFCPVLRPERRVKIQPSKAQAATERTEQSRLTASPSAIQPRIYLESPALRTIDKGRPSHFADLCTVFRGTPLVHLNMNVWDYQARIDEDTWRTTLVSFPTLQSLRVNQWWAARYLWRGLSPPQANKVTVPCAYLRKITIVSHRYDSTSYGNGDKPSRVFEEMISTLRSRSAHGSILDQLVLDMRLHVDEDVGLMALRDIYLEGLEEIVKDVSYILPDIPTPEAAELEDGRRRESLPGDAAEGLSSSELTQESDSDWGFSVTSEDSEE